MLLALRNLKQQVKISGKGFLVLADENRCCNVTETNNLVCTATHSDN